jgi:hypothetical protein
MTVKDLIEKLQQFDPALPAVIAGTWPSVGGDMDVKAVEKADRFTDGSGFYRKTSQSETGRPATVIKIA